ncbi:hypothetical protein FGB62_235g022 [Gracilaria domingensis]|nr:hypothetical protein FGB62_235g022 [Gracilaria domingensis]
MSPPLPENWVEQRTPDGGVYYVNTETDQSQWHFPAENPSSPQSPPASPPAASSSIAPSSSNALSERREEYETGRSVSDSAREFKLVRRKIVEKDTGTKVFTLDHLKSFQPMRFYTAEKVLLFGAGAIESGLNAGIAVINLERGHTIVTFRKVAHGFTKKVYGYRGNSGGDPFLKVEISTILKTKTIMTEVATGRELGSLREWNQFVIRARVEAGLDAALILCMMIAVRSWFLIRGGSSEVTGTIMKTYMGLLLS